MILSLKRCFSTSNVCNKHLVAKCRPLAFSRFYGDLTEL